MINTIIEEFNNIKNEELSEHHKKFFKTQKGDYGEGDKFLGVKNPQIREIAKKYSNINLNDIEILIKNPYHEIRLCALILLIDKYKKNKDLRKKIATIYLNNIKFINNWDLVDISCPHIIGRYEFENGNQENSKILNELADSAELWKERIAIVSTMYFVKKGFFNLTIQIAQKFLTHNHHLIHKAVGWLLREIGKKDIKTLYKFLDKNYKLMPRTMLRYSLEKVPLDKRKHYMKKGN